MVADTILLSELVDSPAALALNEERPQDIHDQRWLLVLTGCIECLLGGLLRGPPRK
jgi:hypothetical protein